MAGAVSLLHPYRYLVAWLWLVATKRLKAGVVQDPPEDSKVGFLCQSVLNKMTVEDPGDSYTGPQTATAGGGGGLFSAERSVGEPDQYTSNPGEGSRHRR